MRITWETVEKLKRYKLYDIAQRAYSIYSSVANRLFPGPVILQYHRVADLKMDSQLLAVSPEHFYEQMQYLKDNYQIVSLNDLKRAIDSRRLNPRNVAVTFDDGYEDNYQNARPVLEQWQIPATIFVVTSYIGSTKEFWWDTLERLLLSPESLPNSLEMAIGGKVYRWPMSGADKSIEGSNELHSRKWDIISRPYLQPRHKVFTDLYYLLRLLNETERQHLLADIARWAGGLLLDGEDARIMSLPQLKTLADGGLIDIGAHTVTHPVLAGQSLEAQRREIIGSKQQLEDILQRPVTTFSYPFGSPGDIDSEMIKLVRDAGFTVACSGFPARISRWSDPFCLPRWIVRDWSGNEFARRLKSLSS